MESKKRLVNQSGAILQEIFEIEGEPANSIEQYQSYLRSRKNPPGEIFMDSTPEHFTTGMPGNNLQKEILNNAQDDTRPAFGRSLVQQDLVEDARKQEDSLPMLKALDETPKKSLNHNITSVSASALSLIHI